MIRYAIKEPQSKKFFAKHNKQKFVTNPRKASLWQTKKDAEKALKSLRKKPQAAIKPLTANMQVIIIDTEKQAVNAADQNNTESQTTNAVDQNNTESQTTNVADQNNTEEAANVADQNCSQNCYNQQVWEQFVQKVDWEEFLEEIESCCKLISSASVFKNLLQTGISNSDKKVLDLAHVAELGVFNASEGYEISMELKRIRQQRRKEKDALLALTEMIPAEKEEDARKNAENCLTWLETIKQGRTYNFRDKEMKKRFGYLLR